MTEPIHRPPQKDPVRFAHEMIQSVGLTMWEKSNKQKCLQLMNERKFEEAVLLYGIDMIETILKEEREILDKA